MEAGAQAESVDAAVRELAAARDQARQQIPLFSPEILHCWNELEEIIEIKLEDLEHRLNRDRESAAEVAFARARELTRAVHELLRKHSQRQACYIMSTDVHTCRRQDPLSVPAQIMWELDCGVVPVVSPEGDLVGIITDRDICIAAYTQGKSLSDCSVESAMSSRVYACTPDDPVSSVVEIMRTRQVHRVPVVDRDGRILGMVSLADIIKYASSLPAEHPTCALLIPTLTALSADRERTHGVRTSPGPDAQVARE